MTTPEERRPGRPDSPGRPGGRRGPRQKSAQRPSERARSGDPARLTAYTVLRSVAEGGYANLELPRLLRGHGMAGRDAAFATELTYGTLRWQGLYDPVIADASGRSVDKIDPPDPAVDGVDPLLALCGTCRHDEFVDSLLTDLSRTGLWHRG